MKKSLYIASLLLGGFQLLNAATYKDLAQPLCDETNKVQYDGQGAFVVESAANTEVEVIINMKSLLSYVNSNDYKSGNPLMLWETNAIAYGLADYADTSKNTGEREPALCCYWGDNVWKPEINIPYATLMQHVDSEQNLKLRIKNNQSNGIEVIAVLGENKVQSLLKIADLKSGKIKKTNGYKVNLNYVTSVTLNTASSLDTQGYEPPKDYTVPFNSKRTDDTTLKRVLFMGDSITHGVNDQTWRWQLFKILVDNGIEAEIVGPREGYTPGYTNLTTTDAGTSYGGVDFPNVHLAQSSGRTHNIISGSNAGMSGVNYGGHSTASTAKSYNCDTWCCLMGTNDLLSDRGYTDKEFAEKMQRMLGGTVSISKGAYTHKANKSEGNMARIATDVLKEDSDVLYLMAVPYWGNHANNNEPDRHEAVKQYNELLEKWVKQYASKNKKNIVFVDINKGLNDRSLSVPFSWPDSMSNKPGRDGLHPNEQGSMIIAGNLAKAMGLAGRTAGLCRAAASDEWSNETKAIKLGKKKKQVSTTLTEEKFTPESGYTVEFTARCGSRKKKSRLSHENGINLTIGDGTNGGTLTFSECGILWENTVLYCMEDAHSKKTVRIAWHPGNEEHNIAQGYYVWVGDMLIGQGLKSSQATPINGLNISTSYKEAEVSSVYWTNKAYAPASTGRQSEQHAYRLP